MKNPRRQLLASLLAVGALAGSASIAVAAYGPSTVPAAAAAAAGLAIATSHASVAGAAAGAPSNASAALADAWTAANAGLDKASDALESNPTDADSGGWEGIATARDAITSGLAHAGAGAANAGDHPTGP